jgi:hypothetical protein
MAATDHLSSEVTFRSLTISARQLQDYRSYNPLIPVAARNSRRNLPITMPKHRRRRAPISNHASRDSFNVAEALEALHTEIVDIEAFAHAAGEAVTRLPHAHASNPELRRIFTRIYTLVSKVAVDVNACVRHGDKLIAALSAHLQNR